MLNVYESIVFQILYRKKPNILAKTLFYCASLMPYTKVLRYQIPESSFLQLVPSFYLTLFFICFSFLFFFSDFLFFFVKQHDLIKKFGFKSLIKIQLILLIKISFFIALNILLVLVILILPLSLESFVVYSHELLESSWSFFEVLSAQLSLSSFLLLGSQFPIIFSVFLLHEQDISLIPKIWKMLFIFTILTIAMVTPTIDWCTQLSFSFLLFFLFLYFISLLQKRLSIKFLEISSLTF